MSNYPPTGSHQKDNSNSFSSDTSISTSKSLQPISSTLAPMSLSQEQCDNGQPLSRISALAAPNTSHLPQPSSATTLFTEIERKWLTDISSALREADLSSEVYSIQQHQALADFQNRYMNSATADGILIGRALDELIAYLNIRSPSDRVLAHYYKVFETWPRHLLILAFERIRLEWYGKSFPKIAEFKKQIQIELNEHLELKTTIDGSLARISILKAADKRKREKERLKAAKQEAADKYMKSLSYEDRLAAYQKYLPEDQAKKLADKFEHQ